MLWKFVFKSPCNTNKAIRYFMFILTSLLTTEVYTIIQVNLKFKFKSKFFISVGLTDHWLFESTYIKAPRDIYINYYFPGCHEILPCGSDKKSFLGTGMFGDTTLGIRPSYFLVTGMFGDCLTHFCNHASEHIMWYLKYGACYLSFKKYMSFGDVWNIWRQYIIKCIFTL